MINNQLRQLHKELYEHALAEAKSLPTMMDPYIVQYAKHLERELPTTFQQVAATTLYKSLIKARVILYGDFHTFRQSQRGLLRILRGLQHRVRSSELALGMELLAVDDQPYVDAWMRGELDEDEMLRLINYQKKWGFAWQNYRMLFEYCRDNAIKIMGFNAPAAEGPQLTKRDQYAAAAISDFLRLHPQKRLFCLIGEYHLAWNHLPKKLLRCTPLLDEAQLVRVFNNLDGLYFSLEPDFAGAHTQYLRLDTTRPTYCVMNSPPWVKWLSVAMWEDQQLSGGELADDLSEYQDDIYDEEEDEYTELRFDFDFHILNIMKHISSFLHLGLDEGVLDHFEVCYQLREDEYPQLQQRFVMPDRGFLSLLHRYSVDGLAVVPQQRIILLQRLSLNHLAEAAGQLLLALQSAFSDSGESPKESFYRRILKYAAGTFATKIINPRFKIYDLGFYRNYLTRYHRRRLYGFAAQKRMTYRALLQHDAHIRQLIKDGGATISLRGVARYHKYDELSHFELSRIIGQIMGARLYRAAVWSRVEPATVRGLFDARLSTSADVDQVFLGLYRI